MKWKKGHQLKQNTLTRWKFSSVILGEVLKEKAVKGIYIIISKNGFSIPSVN